MRPFVRIGIGVLLGLAIVANAALLVGIVVAREPAPSDSTTDTAASLSQ